ncbi:hypothetical protein PGQ11_012812 [Apiospora arundinis]|uniref:Gfd2/YDR514C-like C-terminal domain-containing protein n=1 Tax=Apiospora arundinis TaxID=335852 RepID=A0ABR2I4B8_9PEZI
MMKNGVSKNGLQRVLGLRPYDAGFEDLEPIFVGLDIEAERPEREKARSDSSYQPRIKEVGLALLDSRDLADDVSSSSKTVIRSIGFPVHYTDEEGSWNSICVNCVGLTVLNAIKIPDINSEHERLRNLVIVGHSPNGDITMLKNLGADLDELELKYRVLDTHNLANQILPACDESGVKPKWNLKAVMERLECPFDHTSFHRGESDAHHHLHLMVKLGFRAFDDSLQDQPTPLPISNGPDDSAPPPQQVVAARTRARLQEWYRVEFGDAMTVDNRQGSGSQVPSSPRRYRGRRGRRGTDADS